MPEVGSRIATYIYVCMCVCVVCICIIPKSNNGGRHNIRCSLLQQCVGRLCRQEDLSKLSLDVSFIPAFRVNISRYPVGNNDSDHNSKDIVNGSRCLNHDQSERYRCSEDATKHGSSTSNCIQACRVWSDHVNSLREFPVCTNEWTNERLRALPGSNLTPGNIESSPIPISAPKEEPKVIDGKKYPPVHSTPPQHHLSKKKKKTATTARAGNPLNR